MLGPSIVSRRVAGACAAAETGYVSDPKREGILVYHLSIDNAVSSLVPETNNKN